MSDVETLRAQIFNAEHARSEAHERWELEAERREGLEREAARVRLDLRDTRAELAQVRKELDRLLDQNVSFARESGRSHQLLDAAGVQRAERKATSLLGLCDRVAAIIRDRDLLGAVVDRLEGELHQAGVETSMAQDCARRAEERAQRAEWLLAALANGKEC